MQKAAISRKLISGLGQSVFFSHMGPDGLAALLEDERVSISSCGRDEQVSGKDTACRCLAFILSGRARVTTEDGRVIRELKAGQVFGPASLFGGEEPCRTVVTARCESTVVLFSEELVAELIRSDPDFAMAYVRFLSGRIRFLNRRIQLLTSGESRETLLSYLLREADRQGETFRLPVSLTELAQMLDMGRSSLYRSFDELEADGFLTRRGREITIYQQ